MPGALAFAKTIIAPPGFTLCARLHFQSPAPTPARGRP